MKIKSTIRITEITVEKSETVSINKSHRVFFGWCAKCTAEVWLVTPEEAAHIMGVGAGIIYKQIEARQIHFEVRGVKKILVCLNSLLG